MPSLATYRKKRDFGVTSEPRGKLARKGKQLAFVVQKHAASRLHYDFRLELGGTLKSWAVPKGPSLDPQVKRMAVHVEDHPLDYGGFEGVIPKGQYGAGTVIVWDRGTWSPVGDPAKGYAAGKIKFDLEGEKLRGRWNLVRMRGRRDERQQPWLLIKESDDEARPAAEYDVVEAMPGSVLAGRARAKPKSGPRPKAAAPRAKRGRSGPPAGVPEGAVRARLPLAFAPQLATLVDAPPAGEGWTYEVKFDGYRVLARIDGDDVRLFTRNGNDWTARMQRLAGEVADLGLGSAWLDGEIVVLDDKGNPSFQALQGAFDAAKTAELVYFVFDLPHHDGYDLTRVPLVERRRRLAGCLAQHETPHVRFSDTFDAPVAQLLAGACRKGLEGLIGKRADAPYVSKRSANWVKLKCTQRQEFVIVGYTDPKGSRSGFGSLLLAIHDTHGRLTYAGNVGTGFDAAGLDSLHAKLESIATEKSPLDPAPRGLKGHWVRPKLIAEVGFSEWTRDGRIRHPVFEGLRTDKEARAITREQSAPVDTRVTHGERVIDAASGATKLDLVEYYQRVARHILPHLEARNVSLVRAPQGIAGKHFFQKHAHGDPAPIRISTAAELVAAAQMNMVELHTGNAGPRSPGKPDRVVFDLDPGEGISWASLKESAALTRKMLELLGLEAFLKTSGGKGLHLVVPLAPRHTHAQVKAFSATMVRHMAKTLPRLFVAKSGAGNRVGRIFIDYLRNGAEATTVAAFSARARPGLGVSVPLRWNELAALEAADRWTIANVDQRLKRLRDDPWKDYWTSKQSLAAALKRLASDAR